MADLSRTVEIIFGAVDKNTKATIDAIGGSLTTFDAGIQRVADPVANFTEGLLKAEAALAALAAAYGGYAISEAVKFESAQIDLNKVLSEGDPAIESFTKTVTELSEQYGISATAILQGIANFKQAGFTAKEAADLQKNALDLVIAGDVDAAKASEILISAIKGFGVEASSASRFVEALNNVSNDYATDVAQLAEGMSRVAPILKIMGFSFEEGTGLLTPMIEVFRDGGVAAEALKTGLLKLVDDAKPVTSALAALGVSQTDLNGNMRSGKDIFYDVAKAFTTLDENQKLVFAGQLFGIEQAPKLVTVFDNLAKVNKITASAMAETGSVAKEVELRLASAEGQINRFHQGFVNLARVLGGEIKSNFSGIVGGVTEIENSFRRVVEQGGFNELFNAIRPQLADFEQALKTIAINLPEAFNGIDFSGLLDSFGGLADTFRDSFDQIFNGADLTTVEGLRSAIQTTINIISNLVKVTSEIIKQFDPIFAAIGEAGKQVGSASNETVTASGKLLGAMTLMGDFGSVLGGLLLVINESEADISNVFNTLVGGSRVFTNAMQLAFDAVALAITVGLREAAYAIGSFFDTIGADKLAQKFYDSGNKFNDITQGIKGNLQSNANDMSQAWSQMANGLSLSSDASAQSINKIGAAAEGVAKPVAAIGDASKGSLNDLGNAFTSVTPKITEFSDETKKAVASLAKTIEAAPIVAESVAQMTQKFANEADATKLYNRLKSEGYQVSIDFANGLYKVSAAQAETAKTGQDVKTTTAEISQSFKDGVEAEALYNRLKSEGKNVNIEYANGLFTVHQSQVLTKGSALEAGKAAKDGALMAKEGSKEWKTVQEIMLATQKQTDDFTVQMGELANKRYEIDIRAAIDLQTANIEAETARINSALSATSDVIATLTTGTTNLWDLFGQKAGFVGGEEIKSAALNMERRLDEELAVKKQFTDAIVEKLKAETFRLTSGEPLISIDARELAPELELVFDKILKYTQVKATQQGLAMLVGL